MHKLKYSLELRKQVLKDWEETGNIESVSQKHDVPIHAIYRFKKMEKQSPEKDLKKKTQELEEIIRKKDLENRILKELLKKSYDVFELE